MADKYASFQKLERGEWRGRLPSRLGALRCVLSGGRTPDRRGRAWQPFAQSWTRLSEIGCHLVDHLLGREYRLLGIDARRLVVRIATTADLAGTFRLPTTLPVVKDSNGKLMQDVLLAFVPDSNATKGRAMNGTQRDLDAGMPATARSDEELMVAFSRGSTDAFSELFSRYKQPLFEFFRRRVADPAQAEELTQETFLAVLRASSRYEPRALFRRYLYAIGFKILGAHRRKAAFRATFLGTATAAHEPALPNAIDAEVFLRQAVGKLERLDREILLLREFEQLSYGEIADLLRLPLNTVRSRLFRARMALRDLLAAPAPKLSPEALTESEGRL